ncbi:MAG: C1 family peptidase [Ethanoligenens sp.]
MSMNHANAITEELTARAAKAFEDAPAHMLADSIAKNGIDNTAYHREAAVRMNHLFSHEIDPMVITNQQKSGRCWLFAGTNVLRYHLRDTLHIKNADFELSQSYLMFWDKLEKGNYFLESVLDTASEPKDSRIVMWLFQNPLNDGGQWDMLVSLIDKYGVAPKLAMPESFHSGNSAKMNAVLSRKLRRGGIELRTLYAQGKSPEALLTRKEELVTEFYVLLCCFLGEPPKTFDFVWRDKSGAFHRDAGQTPLGFYHKYFGKDFLNRYVSIINAPTAEKPYEHTYTVKYLGNVIGGRPIKYLNLPSEDLERAASGQIRAGKPVWFGSDVGKVSDREAGILDTALYPYENVLHTALSMDKGDMLDYGESCLTHAMMLLGVDVTDKGIAKWKVENSWGKDVGQKGFFVMSADWFNNYVCQVVVDKVYLTDVQQKALEQPPIALEPWDPIGALAQFN